MFQDSSNVLITGGHFVNQTNNFTTGMIYWFVSENLPHFIGEFRAPFRAPPKEGCTSGNA
jgi:hypothetical protein